MATAVQVGGRFEIGRTLNNTFSVIGRNFVLWAGLAIIFSAVPMLIFQFLILQPFTGAAQTDPEAAFADPSLIMSRILPLVLAVLVWLILALLLTSALARATIEDLSGKRPSMSDCIATAVSLILPAIGIAVLMGLAMLLVALVAAFVAGAAAAAVPSSAGVFAIVFLIILVPMVMLFLRWSVAVPVLVQERAGVLGSMGRSANLTKGSRWAILGLFIIIAIISFVVNLVIGVVLMLFGTLIGAVLSLILQSLVSTLYSTASAASYIELRRVKEGTSVSELAEIFS